MVIFIRDLPILNIAVQCLIDHAFGEQHLFAMWGVRDTVFLDGLSCCLSWEPEWKCWTSLDVGTFYPE